MSLKGASFLYVLFSFVFTSSFAAEYTTTLKESVSDDNISVIVESGDAVSPSKSISLTATNSINIVTNESNISYAPTGIYASKGNEIKISAPNVNISAKYAGIWAQNSTVDSSGPFATVDITADSLNINSEAIAIVAFSQGVVNINAKEATIFSADDAISTRGDATTNINVGTNNITKITGNINFNYNDATSKTAIDAVVNMDLVGAESFWTGNTIVAYDKKPDISKLVVSNSTLTLKDGATWNATQIKDNADVAQYGFYYTALNNLKVYDGIVNIADTERGIYVDNAAVTSGVFNGGPLRINKLLNVTGGTISGTSILNIANGATANIANANIDLSSVNVDGAMVVSGNSSFLSDISGKGSFSVANGATANIGDANIDLSSITLDGTIIANLSNHGDKAKFTADNFSGNGTLSLILRSEGVYKIFDVADSLFTGNKDFNYDSVLYNLSWSDDGNYVIAKLKNMNEIAVDVGLPGEVANTLVNLMQSDSEELKTLGVLAQEQLFLGNVEAVEKAHKVIHPETESVVRSVSSAMQNTVAKLAVDRMSIISYGRSGGDYIDGTKGIWVQGLLNKTKLNDSFNGYTRGVSLGIDSTIGSDVIFGLGYAFANSDIDTSIRDTDVTNNTLFMYGRYKPTSWYIDSVLSYTKSAYEETGDALGMLVMSDYDISTFGANIMTGYDFSFGLSPEIGMRYMHVVGDDYKNDFNVRNNLADEDYLTALLGFKYGVNYQLSQLLTIRPEISYNFTYDLISDHAITQVQIPGVTPYFIEGERLSRLGNEFGLGVKIDYKGLDISLIYDVEFRESYTSQTGLLKLRYNF